MALFRILAEGQVRLATGEVDAGPTTLLPADLTLAGLLSAGAAALRAAHDAADAGPIPPGARILAPLDRQSVWASGVTYLRSRTARIEESQDTAYDRVYEAQRPELFFKARPETVRGPDETVGIRADSTWDVPEPELTLVLDADGEIAALTIGNDMSSRSIEGENTLYLPQAKTYRHSCAIGPALVLPHEISDPMDLGIRLVIERDGSTVHEGAARTSDMKRHVDELRRWLFVANEFPEGVLLMTGTGIVPDAPFTLRPGDTVRISIEGLGSLVNVVETVGRPAP